MTEESGLPVQIIIRAGTVRSPLTGLSAGLKHGAHGWAPYDLRLIQY